MRKAEAYHHPVPLLRNLGALTSWNPLGLSRPVMGLLYLYLFIKLHIETYINSSYFAGRSSNSDQSDPWRQVAMFLSDFVKVPRIFHSGMTFI